MIGNALQNSAYRAIEMAGTPTLINGNLLNALWERAQPGRVQMFLGETEWSEPAYEVSLPATALGAPVLAAAGSSITWISAGWSGVIRALDISDMQGTVVRVTAIVQLVSG